MSTFRENDVKGIAPRKLYKKFGFEEGELIEEFEYPNQRVVLHADKSVDNVIIGTKSYIEVTLLVFDGLLFLKYESNSGYFLR